MSVEIASLMIEVDATKAVSARTNLDDLTAAAGRLDKAADRVKSASDRMGVGHKDTSDAARGATQTATGYASALGAIEKATKGVMSAETMAATLVQRNADLRSSLIVREVAEITSAAKRRPALSRPSWSAMRRSGPAC
jgi:DNA-binding transcriptional regulator YdaS (Cro superfamily)